MLTPFQDSCSKAMSALAILTSKEQFWHKTFLKQTTSFIFNGGGLKRLDGSFEKDNRCFIINYYCAFNATESVSNGCG